ncbi:hypothetical protein [Pseudanabaena sp. FACHB-2040]|uniref:hypothetical protein n=1 Tax=Pseudanabaena sp. FACHB-2040 TaxID=2692859 RepID=UPI001681FF64|nr:hypothetical protein [Pseudanabaena sp. FACHB-2040]MBD2256974.1 hypothetical protein [Pseudanabaena sp. FACHB-2040]
MQDRQKAVLSIHALPEYERKLLAALAFFLGREQSAQAVACLSMYLRQSEPRIIGQLKYYAHKATKNTGQPLDEYDLLDLIAESPDQIAAMLQPGVVHPPGLQDVFEQPIADDDVSK